MHYNFLFLLIQKLSRVLALGVGGESHITVRCLGLKYFFLKKEDEEN